MRHYTCDLAPVALAPERRPGLFRQRRLAPLVGGLREHLDRRGTDRLPACQRRSARRPGSTRGRRAGRLSTDAFDYLRRVTNGSRVLLAGDASARPAGLERALTRAGFLVTEAPPANGELEPDAILITLAGSQRRGAARGRWPRRAPTHRRSSCSSPPPIPTRRPRRSPWAPTTPWRHRFTCPSSVPGSTPGSATGSAPAAPSGRAPCAGRSTAWWPRGG